VKTLILPVAKLFLRISQRDLTFPQGWGVRCWSFGRINQRFRGTSETLVCISSITRCKNREEEQLYDASVYYAALCPDIIR